MLLELIAGACAGGAAACLAAAAGPRRAEMLTLAAHLTATAACLVVALPPGPAGSALRAAALHVPPATLALVFAEALGWSPLRGAAAMLALLPLAAAWLTGSDSGVDMAGLAAFTGPVGVGAAGLIGLWRCHVEPTDPVDRILSVGTAVAAVAAVAGTLWAVGPPPWPNGTALFALVPATALAALHAGWRTTDRGRTATDALAAATAALRRIEKERERAARAAIAPWMARADALEEALDGLGLALAVVAANGIAEVRNGAFDDMFATGGRPAFPFAEALEGWTARIGLAPDLRRTVLRTALDVAPRREPPPLEIPLPDGRVVEARIKPLTDGQVLACFSDISARRAIEEDVLALTETDPLTGVLNRRGILLQIGRALRAAAQDGRPVSALILDIDRFKRINDTYGHPTGDEAIRVLARTSASVLRGGDAIGRLGGEEFAVLLPGADAAAAMRAAERIRTTVAAQRIADPTGALFGMTVSIGVAVSRSADTPDGILEHADQALYAAKNGGRDRCVLAGAAPPRAA